MLRDYTMQLLASLTNQDGNKISDGAIVDWVNNKVSKSYFSDCNRLQKLVRDITAYLLIIEAMKIWWPQRLARRVTQKKIREILCIVTTYRVMKKKKTCEICFIACVYTKRGLPVRRGIFTKILI